jgi:hypothetical protein
MSGFPAAGRCRVAAWFGGWLAGWLGFSGFWRSRREAEAGREGDGQHPAEWSENASGLWGRFDQGDHLGLG